MFGVSFLAFGTFRKIDIALPQHVKNVNLMSEFLFL